VTPEQPIDPDIRRMSVRGLAASYTDEGSGDPPLVFIHGVPGSVRDFRWLAAALRRVDSDVRILRINMPGFAGTEESLGGDMSVGDRAAFVAEVVEQLDLRAFVLCGHSLGGAVAVAVATLVPERVSRLALISSVGITPHRAYRAIPISPVLARVFCSSFGHRFLSAGLRKAFIALGFPSSTPTDELHSTMRAVGALRWPHVRANAESLGNLHIPTTIFNAEDDPLVESAIAVELAAALHADLQLFPTGGHNIQKTRAIEIAEILMRSPRTE